MRSKTIIAAIIVLSGLFTSCGKDGNNSNEAKKTVELKPFTAVAPTGTFPDHDRPVKVNIAFKKNELQMTPIEQDLDFHLLKVLKKKALDINITSLNDSDYETISNMLREAEFLKFNAKVEGEKVTAKFFANEFYQKIKANLDKAIHEIFVKYPQLPSNFFDFVSIDILELFNLVGEITVIADFKKKELVIKQGLRKYTFNKV